MAASAACSNPHVFAHTLRFSARGFLALTKNAWFLEAPYILGSERKFTSAPSRCSDDHFLSVGFLDNGMGLKRG